MIVLRPSRLTLEANLNLLSLLTQVKQMEEKGQTGEQRGGQTDTGNNL